MVEYRGLILRDNIGKIIKKYGKDRQFLLPVLNDADEQYGHINENILVEISEQMNIPIGEIHGVMTFYSFLNHEKLGKHVVRVCRTISCDMANKDRIVKVFEKELGIKFGQTTEDGKFTLLYTNCIGMCDQGPAMLIDDNVYSKLTPEKVYEIIENYREGKIK